MDGSACLLNVSYSRISIYIMHVDLTIYNFIFDFRPFINKNIVIGVLYKININSTGATSKESPP